MEPSRLTEEQRSILRQCLWDLNLTPEEFLDIVEGRLVKKWPDQAFCVARLVESVNWFDVVKLLEPNKISALWGDAARKKVRFKTLREGMDFAAGILQ